MMGVGDFSVPSFSRFKNKALLSFLFGSFFMLFPVKSSWLGARSHSEDLTFPYLLKPFPFL